MARRRLAHRPKVPPRVVIRSAQYPNVWAEQSDDGIRVYVPGAIHRAPAHAPDQRRVLRLAEKLRQALADGDLYVGANADSAALYGAAFGDQQILVEFRPIALQLVLGLWGVRGLEGLS